MTRVITKIVRDNVVTIINISPFAKEIRIGGESPVYVNINNDESFFQLIESAMCAESGQLGLNLEE